MMTLEQEFSIQKNLIANKNKIEIIENRLMPFIKDHFLSYGIELDDFELERRAVQTFEGAKLNGILDELNMVREVSNGGI